ncbi:hypothetical protein [Geodermatophilus sp. URMC 62]
MGPRAAGLVHRFTELLGAEVHVAVRRGSGRTAHAQRQQRR